MCHDTLPSIRLTPATRSDPALGSYLIQAATESNTEGTRHAYKSATKSYIHFCAVRNLAPWPVDSVKIAGWILRIMTTVSTSSLKVYLAAVQYDSISIGCGWPLAGDPLVARTIKYVKRKFPAKEKGLKFAITLEVLMTILPRLGGWPSSTNMCYDDLLFATASIIAVQGLLRGGEFTFKPNQTRPLLRRMDIDSACLEGSNALVVNIRQPKATWWLRDSFVPIFDAQGDFSSWKLWHDLKMRSPRKDEAAPAFQFSNGLPLSKKFMLERSTQMATAAGFSLRDENGAPTPIKMASYRAGGIRSSVAARNNEAIIQLQGRYKSDAWRNYLLVNSGDLRRASQAMWACAKPIPQARRGRVVECSSDTGPEGGCVSGEVEAKLRKVVILNMRKRQAQ